MIEDQRLRPFSWYAIPAAGTFLTVLSGLSFLVVCVLLPLVGPAGAATPFAAENRRAFALYVVLSLLFSLGAIVSKLTRRRIDRSPLPVSSLALCGLNLFLLVALVSGLLSI